MKVQFRDPSMLQGVVKEDNRSDIGKMPQPKMDSTQSDSQSRFEKLQVNENDKSAEKTQVSDKPDFYYTMALKADYSQNIGTGKYSGADIVNVNIANNLLVDGKPINDGLPHRHVFPINNKGAHFKWIDATVQLSPDGETAEFKLHGLSTVDSKTPPRPEDAGWSSAVRSDFSLRKKETKLQMSEHEYNLPSNEMRDETRMEPRR